MTDEQMAAGFDEWMRKYVQDPRGFETDHEAVIRYLRGTSDVEPTYGETCVATLRLFAGLPADPATI